MTTMCESPRAIRIRITRRGRRVLAGLSAVPIAIALVIAALSSGAAVATAEPGAEIGSFQMMTISAGDTLWSLAEQVAPNHDPRDVVDEIADLNGLSGVSVFPGQELAIPFKYAAAEGSAR